MSSCDQVIVAGVDHQVVESHGWHVEAEVSPLFTPIPGEEHVKLGADKQKAFVLQVFTDDINRSSIWEVSGDVRPSLAVVLGFEHMRFEIIAPVAIEG